MFPIGKMRPLYKSCNTTWRRPVYSRLLFNAYGKVPLYIFNIYTSTKQLLDEVEHNIVNYQNRGLCYLPKPKAEADNTDTMFW